ncbi:DNA-directed RNA polymerase I subunit RPA1, partial [Zootermopsis nevadensis]
HLNPSALSFSIFSQDEIKKLSEVKITTPLSFNALGHPLKAGLYDPALGPLHENSEPCYTCSNNVYNCSGHVGYIELSLPVVNPLFHKTIFHILKLACLNCHTLQVKGVAKVLFITKLKLLGEGLVTEAQETEEVVGDILSSEDSTVVDEVKAELMKEKLDEYYKNIMKDCKTPPKTKFVESLINDLLNAMDKSVLDMKKCLNCKAPIIKILSFQNKLVTTVLKADESGGAENGGENKGKKITTVILPDESRDHLRKIWRNEKEFMTTLSPVLKNCDMKHPTDTFFLDLIAVPPPKMRPVNFVNNKLVEHPQTQAYKLIIQDSIIIQNITRTIRDGDTSSLPEEAKDLLEQIRGDTPEEKLMLAWQHLQSDVDHLMDSGMGQSNQRGLKISPEKKEGIIRMHMMGKRVNFAARSVITPDPCLSIEEIGIPELFAKSLTYPVPVTEWNVADLRMMVLNGPDVYPGAVLVENEDGTKTRISTTDHIQRESVAKRLLTPGDTSDIYKGMKVVHRHLCSGDVLLLNRQPTLHRPSIMAHIARILKGERTLRLHYANCKAYNADFDGDEMNAHFPQNELARSEAYNLLNVNNQYLVPKDGTPLSGLIQDHIVAGVHLSVRGRFFGRDEYQQLVFQALSHRVSKIKLLPPAIIKPLPCWSGKQIISTVLINIVPTGQYPISLTSTAKIADKSWMVEEPRVWQAGGTPFNDSNTMSEAEVIIRKGELLCGVLDKTHYGATPYGLIHCMNELYGGSCSSVLLTAFSKLFTSFLQRNGFSLGVEDILVVKAAEEQRIHFISRGRKVGNKAVRSAVDLPKTATRSEIKEKMEDVYQNYNRGRAMIDSSYKSMLDNITNKINKACIPNGLLKSFPYNNLQLMIQSGAKGSTVNAMQISGLLGQIELEGRRPPHMASGKTLPSFTRYDVTPRAGGFVDGRFMTGIKPQEFYFHCMAGREGLIDTAVKTSRSGYLQRCLVKHLEGLVVRYDLSVRDSDGSVVQFCYGEDGRDVMKAQFMKEKQIPFLSENCKAIKNVPLEMLQDDKTSSHIAKCKRKIRKWVKKNGSPFQKNRTTPFTTFSVDVQKSGSQKSKKLNKKTGRSKRAEEICSLWRDADSETLERYSSVGLKCPDPVTAYFRCYREFGALTEKLEQLMNDYLKNRPSKTKHEFCEMMFVKSLQSHSDPGEPVGLLAAQSIGEPSTQMTLNTFHFAGRGEMNVTLGIPRLRELLMTASKNIKTPNMDVPFLPDVHHLKNKAERLKLKLCRVTVSDVLSCVDVTDKLEIYPSRMQTYYMQFHFLPHEAYKSRFCVTPSYVLQYAETQFFKNIFYALRKKMKFRGSVIQVEKSKSSNNEDANDENVDPENVPEVQSDHDLVDRAKKAGVGEEHESSDEEQEGEDDDATTARNRQRHMENQEYEEPEEEEVEEDVAMYDKSEGEHDSDRMRHEHEDNDDLDDDDMLEADSEIPLLQDMPKNVNVLTYEARVKRVISSMEYIVDYDYDTEQELWCKLKLAVPLHYKRLDLTDLLREVAANSVIWEIPSLKRAITYVNPNAQNLSLKTEGINFQEMFKYDKLLDLNRLYSNDIHQIANIYGIEAARRVIVKEMQDVFKVYGIVVDPRHLLLVADYMTFNGKYEPFSRKTIEDHASPLQQMSFESSVNFLKIAVTRGKY